jgi:hypothetical protein
MLSLNENTGVACMPVPTQKCSAMMFRCSIWHLLPWLLLYTHLWPCDGLQHDVLYWFHRWRSNAWPALNVSHMFICTPCNHSSVSYHPLCCKSIGTNTNTTRQALHTRTTCIINLNHVWPISDKTFARNPNGIRGVGLACCHCRMNVDERELYCLFVLIFGMRLVWHGTVVGRHAETGATLSENHVHPVEDVTHEVRLWYGLHSPWVSTDKRPM